MPSFPTSYRWQITALLFVATTINYLDRQVIGLLKPTLETVFHWTERDYGYIVMAFQAAYALSFLGFGRAIDRVGAKLGYSLAVGLWSLAAVLHAVATSSLGFGAFRALLGLGEGGNFPAAIKTVTEWFPRQQRALATGIFNSGTNIGAVAAPVLVPWLLGHYGWRPAFLVTGGIGFVWLFFWWRLYSPPRQHPAISAEELAYVTADADEQPQGPPVTWRELLRFRQTWAFVLGKLLTDPVWWFFLFWLPAYFSSTFHLDLKKPSLPLILVYSAATIGSVGGGYISGFLIGRGWTARQARRAAMLLFALCIVPVAATRYATSLGQVIALLGLAVAAHQAWSANLFTLVSDMFPPRQVSSVVGLGGMMGSLGGIAFPFFVGFVLDRYKAAGHIEVGYNLIFLFCAGAYLLAWLVIQFFTRETRPVDVPHPPELVA